jgi:hypothetical protein
MHADIDEKMSLWPYSSELVSSSFPPLVPPWFLESLHVLHEAIIHLLLRTFSALHLLIIGLLECLSIRDLSCSLGSSSSGVETTLPDPPPQSSAVSLQYFFSFWEFYCPRVLCPISYVVITGSSPSMFYLAHLMAIFMYFLLLLYLSVKYLSAALFIVLTKPLDDSSWYSSEAIQRVLLLFDWPPLSDPSLRFSVEHQGIIYFTSRPATTYAYSYRPV